MPIARDRMVECYFWILGVYFEPQYLLARRMLTKVTALTSIIDDIYDVYGTLEELVLFTDAIERWEISAIDQLPEYMKPCYQALLDVYNMIDEEMARKKTSYRVHYAKFAMKILVRAYFEEAKWFHQGYVPSIEEYMRVALVTFCYTMLTTTSLMGMGEVVSKEAFDWVSSGPLIVQASSVVCRLMDDIVSRKLEQKRGHVASAVECYMNQHDASEEEVLIEFHKQATNAWKDINAECLHPIEVPMPLKLRQFGDYQKRRRRRGRLWSSRQTTSTDAGGEVLEAELRVPAAEESKLAVKREDDVFNEVRVVGEAAAAAREAVDSVFLGEVPDYEGFVAIGCDNHVQVVDWDCDYGHLVSWWWWRGRRRPLKGVK
ncbi:hypothetical protein TEA_015985 [Camellia sinensis var. sinensis]|uniref:Terpene synthase metal-binding domain-containing protein n=1 Tax=Camellia sinensis var. sinensis TaxID=542762 RepID=A0A4S4DHA5_CAMSN|nr:hypothetical protein TEA_015985 [Camellia sinensis var. sinensis]